jgi:peptidoglycan/xylan/chitin deacetylase (PgdA/CDA1 family)
MRRATKAAVRALLLGLALAALPAASAAWGTLDDIRYKVKGADGNIWDDLLGRGDIVRGDEQKGAIAFTFDDGPDHRTTPTILDTLDRRGVKGAFFINGYRIHQRTAGGVENQTVLRDMHRRGHFIGNHTFAHKDITALDDEGWRLEVTQVEQIIRGITGRRPYLFRPPFGATSPETTARLAAEGYTVVMWNLDSQDWMAKSPDELVARTAQVIEANPDGGVLLMHDTNQVTAEALPLIIEWIDERNADLVALGKRPLQIVGIEHFVRNARPAPAP